MLPNNNQQVITRMASGSLKNNRRRSFIMITATMLSAFMLFSVLTVGVTYFKMQRLQNIRMAGAEYDALMYGVTEEQRKMCEENPDINATGIAAIAGSAVETEADSTVNVNLMWVDDTYWNIMMEPAREWVKGEYPKELNEIMVTRESLKECGMENLEVGDCLMVTYDDDLGTHTKEFRISGMWDGFGVKKVFYMSKAFYDQCGKELASVTSGRFFIDFKQKLMPQKDQNEFIDSMNLGQQQHILFTADSGYSVEILMGTIGLILITCFCAYLLIYNIMYLSVAGNVRYYGLLQTVGMTGGQVYRLIIRQMLLVGMIGIAGGIILGSVISLFVIPEVIKLFGISADQIQVSFHPLIFILTVLITGLTVYAGGRKPAKKAVSISPIEATGYRPLNGKKVTRKTGKGKLLWQMAKEQIAKDKKKSCIVILSLGASLSVFLCLITLMEGQRATTVVSSYINMDMVMQNDTLKRENREDWKQLIDQEFLNKITDNEGVSEVNPILSTEIIVPWEPDFADTWMREFYAMWMGIPYEDDMDEYKEHPENFGSFMIGITEKDFDDLNEILETPVDREPFLNGKTCLLYRHQLDLESSDVKDKQVMCAEYGNGGNTRSFEIAGFADDSYYSGALIGYPPTIIVIDSIVKDFVADPFVYKAGIKYHEEYDERVESDIQAIMQNSKNAKDFSYDSKIEEMKTMEKAQGNMKEIGAGIVLILALIGVLNYINTVAGNIQNRQVELAIMESVGMTDKQMDKMLMLEGVLFAGCSLLLTATLGVGITYGVFQSMNYHQIAFSIPVLPMLAMSTFITIICAVIPLVTMRLLSKKHSVVERIRGFE